MKINTKQDGSALVIAPEGRLDTLTAPELEAEMSRLLDSAETLTLDCAGLEYVSSAGLRVILNAHKTMSKKGGMRLVNVGELVQEVLEVTGFTDILNIE